MKIENFPKSDMKESPFFMVFVEGGEHSGI